MSNEEVTAHRCIAVSCEHFGVTRAALLSRARPPSICWPRQVAMILAYDLTLLSHNQLKRIFQRRNHTTILYAYNKVRARLSQEQQDELDVVRGKVLNRK